MFMVTLFVFVFCVCFAVCDVLFYKIKKIANLPNTNLLTFGLGQKFSAQKKS